MAHLSIQPADLGRERIGIGPGATNLQIVRQSSLVHPEVKATREKEPSNVGLRDLLTIVPNMVFFVEVQYELLRVVVQIYN